MGRPDATSLLPLAESIADGSPVDWNAVEASARAEDQALIRQLRILSDLATLHRTLPAHPGELPDALVGRRTAAAPAIGRWAHLDLIERIGSGTFGEVYRAWDRHLEREVALKLLRSEEAVDDSRASRIVTEGRLLARVHHPNVVTVHGVAVHDGRVGLWMELVAGATLEQGLCNNGSFSAAEAAVVGIDLCRALAAIHKAGLIHRDVKAQNVLREEGGRIVLMDLGTGREILPAGRQGPPDLTGTPLYLAPEIFSGAQASERTDLFSLGVLLYHLVTESFPVQATTIEELKAAHAQGTARRLRDARADLPTGFVRVVDRAIANDPDDRYASAGELESDLAKALESATMALRPGVPAAAGRPWHFVMPSRFVLAAMIVLALGLAAIPWIAGRWKSPTVAAGVIRSIAVLPLVNLSGDPAREYFADGMTDELIGTLGRMGGVNVISRTSTMQFKGSKEPLPAIARRLHVDAVVEGSVTVMRPDSGGMSRVRVNARLIYAGTDTQVWDKTFERVVGDVFTLQRDVAAAVADGINLRLKEREGKTPAAAVKTALQRHEPDFETFNLYLEGRYYWNIRTEEGLNRSVAYLQQAIDRDPAYALAYAGLADTYNVQAMSGFSPRNDTLQRAAAAASKALALDGTLGEAHSALGFIYNERLRWEAAEREYKLALELNPGHATAHHWYANYLGEHARFPEAIDEIQRALVLDPLSVNVNAAAGSIYLVARRYDDAIAQLEKALAMGVMPRAHMVLAEAHAHKKDYARAVVEIDKAAALTGGGGAELRADVGYILAASGRRSQALEVATELIGRHRRQEDGAAGGVAVVFAALNDPDRVFEWLDRAKALLDPVLSDLKTDPRFDNVRNDPRFTKLLATVGFTQ